MNKTANFFRKHKNLTRGREESLEDRNVRCKFERKDGTEESSSQEEILNIKISF